MLLDPKTMDTARTNSKKDDHHQSSSSLSSEEVNSHPTETETSSVPFDGEEDNGSESKNDVGAQDNEEVQRQRDRRLAMNRESARERRKRKRVLIEELQEKSQHLTCANVQLHRANEQLRGEVAQLTAILKATQPALASLLSSKNSALSGIDPSAVAAASLLLPGGNAAALAALQQQERARALIEAEEANRAVVAAAAAQISMPQHGAGVSGAAVPCAQDENQQRQLAHLLQNMGGSMAGGMNPLLASIMGGAGANSQAAALLGGQRRVSSSGVTTTSLAHRMLAGQQRNVAVPGLGCYEAKTSGE